MRYINYFLCSLLPIFVGCVEEASPIDLWQVDIESLPHALLAHELLLTAFFTPWCHHCTTAMPALQRVTKKLVDTPEAKLALIDMSLPANLPFLKQYPIYGYPSLLLFKHGELVEGYSGARTLKGIMEYLARYISLLNNEWEASPLLQSIAEIEEYQESLRHTAENAHKKGYILGLGVFPNTPEGPMPSLFSSGRLSSFLLTDTARGSEYIISSAWATSSQISTYFAVVQDSLIVLSAPSVASVDVEDRLEATGTVPLSHNNSMEDISNYLLSYSKPAIIQYSPTNLPLINAFPDQTHVLFFLDLPREISSASSEISTELYSLLEDVARLLKHKFLFIHISSTDLQICQLFGYTADQFPQIVIADISDPNNLRRFNFPFETGANPTKEQLIIFLAKYQSGLLPVFQRSQTWDMTMPEGPKQLPKTLIAMNFNKFVLDPEYDAFVYFFAPWCAFCKGFDPVFEDLHEYYENDAQMMIVKIDNTVNDVFAEGLVVRAFPSLFLFKSAEKTNPIEYSSERSLERIVHFIEEFRSTHGPVGQDGQDVVETEQDEIMVEVM